MKILLLAPQPFFQLRGTPIAVRRVCEVLCAAGHVVDLLTLHEGADVEIAGCTIHRIARPPLVRSVPPGFSVSKVASGFVLGAKAIGMCRKNEYDVVHAVEDGVFIAMLLQRVFGVPYVFDMDSSMPEQLVDKFPGLGSVLRPLRWAETAAIRRSSGVVAVCKALEDVARQASSDIPIVRIEDVSPVPIAAADAPTDVDWNTGPVVLYVGNLERYQGIDLLLSAFARVLDARPNARLVVVGGTEAHVAHYEQMATELGIGGATRFLGPRALANVGPYLKAASVLVSPRTQGHNTPMKIFSYLESGTPVVATRLPTHTQVLDDDTSSLADATPGDMARAIGSVLDNPDLALRISSHGLHRMATEFAPATLDRKLVDFYEGMAASLCAAERPVLSGNGTAVLSVRP